MRAKHRTLAEYFERTLTTQRALAAKVGVSRPYMSMLVSGVRRPGLGLALRIERATGVPVESFIAEERAS